jgi:hypothetical protein
MDLTWFVYTPLGLVEMQAVEQSYRVALAAYFDEHGKVTDEVAQLDAASMVPKPSEVSASYRKAGKPVPPLVMTRLRACKRGFRLEHPGNLAVDKLQVSALRYLLRRVGLGLIDWGDGLLEPVEEGLHVLDRHPDAGPMGLAGPSQNGDSPSKATSPSQTGSALHNPQGPQSGPSSPTRSTPSASTSKASMKEKHVPQLAANGETEGDGERGESLTPAPNSDRSRAQTAKLNLPGLADLDTSDVVALSTEVSRALQLASVLLERASEHLLASGSAQHTICLRAQGELFLLRARVNELVAGTQAERDGEA